MMRLVILLAVLAGAEAAERTNAQLMQAGSRLVQASAAQMFPLTVTTEARRLKFDTGGEIGVILLCFFRCRAL